MRGEYLLGRCTCYLRCFCLTGKNSDDHFDSIGYLHSEISGCRVNSSRHLFSSTLSPTLETNEIGKHTVELLNLFLNPRSSDADFDNFTCKWVTCHVSTLISTPLICPRSKPPEQITNLSERSLKLTKHKHHF